MIRAASSFMAHVRLRSVPTSLQRTNLTSASAHANISGLIASREYNCCRQYSSTGVATEHGAPWMGYLLFGIPCAATAYLGTWQLQRYQWKSNLIASREEQLSKEPISLRALYESEDQILEFHKVLCEGALDIKSSKFIGPRVRSALGITKDGYLMITPFTPSDGTPPVLINRGWVPASYKVKFDSGAPEEDGSKRCKLITTLRSSEKPSSFVPDNTDDTWFWIDVPSLAQACGLPRETPMLAVLLPDDADPTNPEYPLGQPLADVTRVSTMPIDHLNYAATWYTLTAAMLYISYRRLHPNMARRMMPSK